MDTKEVITILQFQQGAKIVSATYPDGGGAYHFKNVVGVFLEKGDKVVVETKGIEKVVEILDPDVSMSDLGCALNKLSHVVAKVYNQLYLDVKTAEDLAYRRLALSQVTSRLNEYRRQIGSGALDEARAALTTYPQDDVLEDETEFEALSREGLGKTATSPLGQGRG